MSQKFINLSIISGHKTKSKKKLKAVFKSILISEKIEPKNFIKVSLISVKPLFLIKKKRLGFKVSFFPVLISKNDSFLLAFKWVLESSRSEKNRNFNIGLIKELKNSLNNKSRSVQKKINWYNII